MTRYVPDGKGGLRPVGTAVREEPQSESSPIPEGWNVRRESITVRQGSGGVFPIYVTHDSNPYNLVTEGLRYAFLPMYFSSQDAPNWKPVIHEGQFRRTVAPVGNLGPGRYRVLVKHNQGPSKEAGLLIVM